MGHEGARHVTIAKAANSPGVSGAAVGKHSPCPLIMFIPNGGLYWRSALVFHPHWLFFLQLLAIVNATILFPWHWVA